MLTVRLLAWGAIVVGLLAQRADAQLIQHDPVEAVMLATGRSDPMPLIEERLTVTIDGQHATTTLLQVYENNTGGQTEGRYKLRAGFNAAVEGFSYWNGEQKIVGEVFEKQTARQVYDSVTSRRRDPGLLEQDGEGAFSFKVFPIESKEKKRVELRWTKWLERSIRTVRYRAPVTRRDATIVIDVIGNVKNVKSSTHRLQVDNTSNGVRLRSEGGKGTGEIVLEWDADEPDWQPSVYVQPGGKHDGWFALSIAAPAIGESKVAAKDVTIVVDRSGSMHGDPMEHARQAAADMIALLDKRDRVNVIAFSDEVDPLFRTPQPLTEANRKRAIAFAEGLKEGGGTDIALALKTAIKSQERDENRPRVIVFMTDGQSDVQPALDAANADTGDVRLFTLGLGEKVNRPLLDRLANLKRGRFVYIAKASEIRPEVGKLAANIQKPLLVDVSIDVEGPQPVRMYPRTMTDLFAEHELLVTGRLRGNGTAKFIIKGKLAGKPVTFTRTVDLAKVPQRPWVGRLWAKSRVAHLLEELAFATAEKTEMTNEVIDLALAYNFVTPYTSFLAIPDSELGNMRHTVEEARRAKSKILADNPDAAGLKNLDEDDAKYGRVAQGTMSVDISGAAPSIDQAAPPGRADYDGEDEESGGGENAISADRKVRGKGCAGCATSTSSEAGLLLLVMLVVLRRRRR